MRPGRVLVAAAAAGGLLVSMLVVAVGNTAGRDAAAQADPLACTAPSADTTPVPAGGRTPPATWRAEQVGNAATITRVTLAGVNDPSRPDFTRPPLPARAAVIAVATAMQESKLQNLTYGDRDSLGLFQQRPSQGWGSPDQIMDPRYATNAFLARLIHVPGWTTMPLTDAAQAVQRSAFPAAYAQWERDAAALVAAAGGGNGGPAAGGGGTPAADCHGGTSLPPDAPPSARAAVALRAAQSQLGADYVWGGGNAQGPTTGSGGACQPGTAGCGYDCSGLMIYAWASLGITLPHFSGDQAKAGTRIPLGQARPGDLIFLSSNGADTGIHHVAMIYPPDGDTPRIIEAQKTGVPVQVRSYRATAEPEILPYAVRLA